MAKCMSLEAAYAQNITAEYIAYYRFKMFFVGLIFAMISYIGTNASSDGSWFLKMLLIFSMIFLLISGVVMLVQLDGCSYKNQSNRKYPDCIVKVINFYNKKVCSQKSVYWVAFGVGMFFLTLYFCFKI